MLTSRSTWLGRLLDLLPKGQSLPDDVWARRHGGILLLLWAHVPAIVLYALLRGESLLHGLVEAAIVAAFAAVAQRCRADRRVSTLAACLGLLTSSAMLVHLSGGVIEMHFHFFVVIGIVTLYQDWQPFLVAIGYVVLEHGVGGALVPGSVYNHESAVRDPWTWAAVHGAFILAMSATGVASWRLNEALLSAVSVRESALADSQRVARLGSWEWDIQTNLARWSDAMRELVGVGADVPASYDTFVAAVHPADRDLVVRTAAQLAIDGVDTALDVRFLRSDGSILWAHIRSHASKRDALGRVTGIAGTMQDISDRIAVDTELREALSLLSATLDATADGILVIAPDLTITTVNQQFVDMWRLPPGVGVVGTSVRDLIDVVLPDIADQDRFVERARVLYQAPDMESLDTVEFIDGRVFERYSTPQRVGGAVVGRVWTFRDVTEQKRLQEELAHQAFHDPLTGLANTALFRELVEHALARSARQHVSTAVLFIDLDNFKTVNDSLGHTVGDQLLVAVTDRLRGCIRPSDTTARLGGDEFAVLVEEAATASEVSAIAERIIAELRRPFAVSGTDLFVSASIGIAFGHGDLACDQLLRNADLAMYTAKHRGRGRFEVYEPDMHAAALDRLEIEADLRRAIERDELVVHYQPIVDLASNAILGVEALVRWEHPTRGLVAPSSFIPLAEETGLINEIGQRVLEVACAQTRAWQDVVGPLVVNVNLSPRELLEDGIVDRVASVLLRTGLPAASLVLEITEGAMVKDGELAISQLNALKALGVRLAIDDFGTGYSALSYLQRFPVDIVKIDRSFVELVGTSPEESSLASAIVSLAHVLHLETIAEGIESESQATALRALGCDLAQGFHLAVPATADRVTEQLLACRGATTTARGQ